MSAKLSFTSFPFVCLIANSYAMFVNMSGFVSVLFCPTSLSTRVLIDSSSASCCSSSPSSSPSVDSRVVSSWSAPSLSKRRESCNAEIPEFMLFISYNSNDNMSVSDVFVVPSSLVYDSPARQARFSLVVSAMLCGQLLWAPQSKKST